MARFGRYNVGFNRNANVSAVLVSLIMLLIWLYVGDEVIDVLDDILDVDSTTNTFYNTYRFLGICSGQSGGLVGIIGILLGVSILVQVFRVTRV